MHGRSQLTEDLAMITLVYGLPEDLELTKAPDVRREGDEELLLFQIRVTYHSSRSSRASRPLDEVISRVLD